jgi:hypothetical protein
MSKGILIFAFNNSEVDYVKIACYAARQAKKHLKVPISLVTDSKGWLEKSQPDSKELFDKVYQVKDTLTTQTKKFFDGSLSSKSLVWKNLNRSDCFSLTPYKETLVIDCDYIINSNNLSKIWGSPHEFLIYKGGYDLAQWRDTSSFEYVNQNSVPFYWATAFYFKKNKKMEAFFNLIENIKDNWIYYKNLHSINSPMFRNDFAFSIAIHMMNGSIDGNYAKPLPGTMYYSIDRDLLVDHKDNAMTILVQKEKFNGEYTLLKTSNLDVHVMNKFSLTRVIDNESKK